MRPKPFYETEHDRAMQREIAEALKQAWNLSGYHMLGYNQVLDCLLETGGEAYAFAEIKDRPNATFGRHREGYLFSLTKVFRAHQIAEIFGLPTFLVVRFGDRSIWTAPFAQMRHDKLVWFGRSDGTQEQDHEPGAVMPWDAFTRLPARTRWPVIERADSIEDTFK